MSRGGGRAFEGGCYFLPVAALFLLLAGRVFGSEHDARARAALALARAAAQRPGDLCDCAATGVCTCGPACRCDRCAPYRSHQWVWKLYPDGKWWRVPEGARPAPRQYDPRPALSPPALDPPPFAPRPFSGGGRGGRSC